MLQGCCSHTGIPQIPCGGVQHSIQEAMKTSLSDKTIPTAVQKQAATISYVPSSFLLAVKATADIAARAVEALAGFRPPPRCLSQTVLSCFCC